MRNRNKSDKLLDLLTVRRSPVALHRRQQRLPRETVHSCAASGLRTVMYRERIGGYDETR